jgi:hypothetical protein
MEQEGRGGPTGLFWVLDPQHRVVELVFARVCSHGMFLTEGRTLPDVGFDLGGDSPSLQSWKRYH